MAKARILIVDDEEDILELLKYNISKEGFDVISAENGEEGLALAHSHAPDLIVLDLMMPGIDGLDVCKKLKAEDDTRAIPVIMLTAKGTESDIIVGLELGADDYVSKPFSPKVLMARIKSVLRRSGIESHGRCE
jgi:two-component system alkaline phosphatase synthesis response regulator PhoP